MQTIAWEAIELQKQDIPGRERISVSEINGRLYMPEN